jgi:hypothetical protein
MARQPLLGKGCSLSRLHNHIQIHYIRYYYSGRLISPTERPLPNNTKDSQERNLSPAGFEPAIPTTERRNTHTLDGAAAEIRSVGQYEKNVLHLNKIGSSFFCNKSRLGRRDVNCYNILGYLG